MVILNVTLDIKTKTESRSTEQGYLNFMNNSHEDTYVQTHTN